MPKATANPGHGLAFILNAPQKAKKETIQVKIRWMKFFMVISIAKFTNFFSISQKNNQLIS